MAITCALPTSWPILWHLSPHRQQSLPRRALRRLALAFATKPILGFPRTMIPSMNITVQLTSPRHTFPTLQFRLRQTFMPSSPCTLLTSTDYRCLTIYRPRPLYITLKSLFLHAALLRTPTPTVHSPWTSRLMLRLSLAAGSRLVSTASALRSITSVACCTRTPRCAPARAVIVRSRSSTSAPAVFL